MSVGDGAMWRILSVHGQSASLERNLVPSTDVATALADAPNCMVKQLAAPTLADIHQALADFQPNILYIWAGCSGDPDPAVSPLQALALGGEDELLPEDLPELVAGLKLHALVLNLASEGTPVAEIQPYVPHIVRWKPEPDVAALNAAAFAHTLFSLLRQPALSFTEAFAMANHTLRAHGCSDTGAKRSPIHPVLVSAEAPELPGTKPQPIPHIEGVDLSLGFSRSVPGWEDTRLLAPMAEVTLHLVAAPGILDTDRLAALGLTLRAQLSLEVRRARVIANYASTDTHPHILPSTTVGRVVMQTASGPQFPVVVGIPPQVMDNKGLLEAAVQATLTCDALSLRFQMPPYGTPSPEPRADPAVARGTPCTPIQVLTSVWVVSVLRTIAKDPANRLLPLLGIGAVSTQPVLGFTDDDAVRYQLLQSQQPLLGCIPLINYSHFNQMNGPPASLWDMNAESAALKPDAKAKGERGTGRETKFDELTANAAPVEQWHSARPPLPQCTQQVFLNDLIAFLTSRFGWTIHAAEFPNSVLNGVPLDLFNLYRAVVSRGGFRMGNAINWKGEIFTKMANWTADHKMTGVGNALKRHYRKMLWEYERANQRDIAGDKCMLCQGGPESGNDWVACGQCHRWQHIACDPRAGLGDLKQFADSGKVFSCVDCSKIKADQEQQQQQMLAGAMGGGADAMAVDAARHMQPGLAHQMQVQQQAQQHAMQAAGVGQPPM